MGFKADPGPGPGAGLPCSGMLRTRGEQGRQRVGQEKVGRLERCDLG